MGLKDIDKLDVAELCKKADEFFQKVGTTIDHIRKPFGNIDEAPQMLFRLALLLNGLKLGKGMKVLDFGAGSCWMSRMIGELGCFPISLDPSKTALNMGKTLFEKMPLLWKFAGSQP